MTYEFAIFAVGMFVGYVFRFIFFEKPDSIHDIPKHPKQVYRDIVKDSKKVKK
jgi:hypothetical protein